MNSTTPTPTAAECLSCATTGGWVPPTSDRPARARGLCALCYGRHNHDCTLDRFPLVGGQGGFEMFEGFPPDHSPILRDYPEQPALIAPLHPPLPAATRWGHVVWFSRPQHDPIGRRLFDAETRHPEIEAA